MNKPVAGYEDWNLWDDDRTNAELRARWAELGKEGNASHTVEEAKAIMAAQDEVSFTLQMRRLHGIGDDWIHPRLLQPLRDRSF